MSELLTTGQMIDRLKVGEVAVSEKMESHDNFIYRVKKTKTDSIYCLDLDFNVTGHHMLMQGDIVKLKWTILPNYVSFEEAMKAVSEGETAVLHSWGKQKTFFNKEGAGRKVSYEFGELLNGKWTIEEDNNESK